MAWRDDSDIKSSCYSSNGPEVWFPVPMLGDSQLSITLAPQDPTFFIGLCIYLFACQIGNTHTQTHTQTPLKNNHVLLF